MIIKETNIQVKCSCGVTKEIKAKVEIRESADNFSKYPLPITTKKKCY